MASATGISAGIAITSGRGVITLSTLSEEKRKTRCSMNSCSAFSSPASRLALTTSRNSSAPRCARDSTLRLTPSSFETIQPLSLSTQMAGRKSARKRRSGPAMISATRSGYCSATPFGASSPAITCSAVMIAKAIATATACPPIGPTTGSSSPARAGSPIQPRARLASVMPNWQAAM